MQPIGAIVETYLLIEQPRQRVGHWSQALAALDSPMAPPVGEVVAYYDPTCDQALIAMRYDALALGEARLSFVVEVALLAEVGMIQPAELSDYERKRFLGERLARCTIQIHKQRSVRGALNELVRRLKEQRAAKSPPPPPPPKPSASLAPRGEDDPGMVVAAKGTRDLARISQAELETKVESPRTDSPHRHVIARTATKRLPTNPETVKQPASHAEPAKRSTTNTRLVDPDEVLGRGTQPPTGDVPGMIYARYLRGGHWQPARVGALSLKGAALLAGALPRLKDHVDVELQFGQHRALVRGNVGKVSTVLEAETTGASTFSVDFELDQASRRQLTELLTAARAANVTIKPPPARQTRRFPVEWPMALTTPRGSVKAHALDVSNAGMFVRPASPLVLDATLDFSIVIDDGSAPVVGRAKVVRRITEAEAKRGGLAPGFGLQIAQMGDASALRWTAFIARIERRADKRVLIGASPARFAELQAGLAASGYAVTGGTDPGALVQLASADSRPADAVLIDAGWLNNGAAASWVESLFSARNVPCVTVQGDSRRARSTIDRLLEVIE